MTDRIDHFAYMKGQEPQGDPPEVEFSQEQLDYLDRRFGQSFQLGLMMERTTSVEQTYEQRGKAAQCAFILAHIATLVKVNR